MDTRETLGDRIAPRTRTKLLPRGSPERDVSLTLATRCEMEVITYHTNVYYKMCLVFLHGLRVDGEAHGVEPVVHIPGQGDHQTAQQQERVREANEREQRA